MKFRNILPMVLVCVLVIVSCMGVCSNPARAAVNPGGTVSPQYTHTKKVVAQLWSDNPGKATCSGKITVYDKNSTISMTVRLLKKSGSSWSEVASWSSSGTGSISYSITKERSITSGTYKVRVSGTITTTDGKSETVSKSTAEKIF